MTLILRADLPMELISLNRIRNKHWSTRQRLKKEIGKALTAAKVKPDTSKPGKRRLVLTRYMKPRERLFDSDNFAGGSAKLCIDLLTELGYWPDDSDKHLTREYRQEKATPERLRSGLLTGIEVWEEP